MTQPNLDVVPNVMLEQTGTDAEIAHLPGDLAVAVYKYDRFRTPQLMKRGMSERQYVEYLQYLRCERCGNTCAGSCEQR